MPTQILFRTERPVPGSLARVARGIEELATGDGTSNYVTWRLLRFLKDRRLT